MKKFYWLFIITHICYANNELYYNRQILNSDTDNKLILQIENSFYNNAYYQSYSLNLFTSNKIQIGLQSLNHHITGIDFQTFEKDTYLSISKSFEKLLFDKLDLSIGTINGTNLDGNTKHLHSSSYLDISNNITEECDITLGILYGNHYLATTSNDIINFHFGTSYRNDYISSSIDFYSGNNNLSGIMTNLSFKKVFANFRPYVGVQASTPYDWDNVSGSIGFTYKLF